MTRDEVRIELPFPPKELSPNARVHWREKAAVVADYRETVGWIGRQRCTAEALTANRPPVIQAVTEIHVGKWETEKVSFPLTPPVRAAVTFVVPNRHKRDLDNLLAMLKPAWDGLTDAGVLAGDDSEQFSVESAKVEWAAYREATGPCVIVVLKGAK